MKTIALFMLLCVSLFSASAKETASKEYPTVKVFLKSGETVEGALVKDWFTAKQSFALESHLFTLQQVTAKVKYTAEEVDSLQVLTDNAKGFNPGEVFLSYGQSYPTLWNKDKKVYKMHRRLKQTPRISLCEHINMANYNSGSVIRNYSQRMICYTMLLDGKQMLYFAEDPPGLVPYKAKVYIKDLVKNLKETEPQLAAALEDRFLKTKKDKKEKEEFTETLDEVFDFCSKWLNQ